MKAHGQYFPFGAQQFGVSVTKDLNMDLLLLATNKLVLKHFNHILNLCLILSSKDPVAMSSIINYSL